MVKIGINTKNLDDRVVEEILELQGPVFAILSETSWEMPTYVLFTDTSKYDAFFRDITKGWKPTEDWGEKFKELFKKRPDLRKKISAEAKHNVPTTVLQIPHESTGSHGELHLKYANATITFMPIEDYTRFFQNDPVFIDSCRILHDGKTFIKGNPSEIKRYGAQVKRN